jgi:thioredoxin 1
VMSIPTLLVFKNGELVDKTIGYQPKEALVQLLEKHV